MSKSVNIVEDLDKVSEANKKEGVQIFPGYAYMERNVYLQHGDGYQYPIDTFIKYISLQESIFEPGVLGYIEMADTYNLTWDASQSPSGIYFVKAESAEYIQTQKLMLIK